MATPAIKTAIPATRRPTWQIAADIANAFDPETGEVDAAAVDGLVGELADKAEAVHYVVSEHEAHAAACKAEAKRLNERASALDNKAGRLRAYLLSCLQASGQRKLATPLVTASIVAGKERVDLVDAEAIPVAYLREKTTVEADKVAIKAALKAGEVVPGAALVRGEETLKLG